MILIQKYMEITRGRAFLRKGSSPNPFLKVVTSIITH